MIAIWRAGLDNMSSSSFARQDPANSGGNFIFDLCGMFGWLENDPSLRSWIAGLANFSPADSDQRNILFE